MNPFEAAVEAWKSRALAAERELERAHARETMLLGQVDRVLADRFPAQAAVPVRSRTAGPVGGPLIESLAGDGDFHDDEQLADELNAIAKEHRAWRQERENDGA